MLCQSVAKVFISAVTLLWTYGNVRAWTVAPNIGQRKATVRLGNRCDQGGASSTLPYCSRPRSQRTKTTTGTRTTSSLGMALDYNDPVVAEEFGKVQTMQFEEVEEELLESGIPVSATTNDMDAKLMLVEVRLRMSGRMPGSESKAKAAKTSFSSKYEEAMYTKPVFKELVEKYKGLGDQNSVNVAVEYVNDRKTAMQRYGDSYGALVAEVERALTAPPPVKSKVLSFAGFPANMGEDACKMTLEALGPLVSFECAESEDFPVLAGKVEYEDIDAAKKAVEQYNGMDMGMGTKLELASV